MKISLICKSTGLSGYDYFNRYNVGLFCFFFSGTRKFLQILSLKIWQSAHDCNFESSAIRFYEIDSSLQKKKMGLRVKSLAGRRIKSSPLATDNPRQFLVLSKLLSFGGRFCYHGSVEFGCRKRNKPRKTTENRSRIYRLIHSNAVAKKRGR